MLEAIQAADSAILLFIQNNLRFGALNLFFKAMSFLGDGGALWVAAAVILLLFNKTRRGGLDLALSLLFAAVICNLVIKGIAARPRPYSTIEGLEILIKPLSSYSFPSGHACSSFASATALCLAFRKQGGAWAFLPAALISLSRVYVGVHYPTDVLAGAALGALVALAVYKLSCRFIKSDLTARKNE
ncbi:MAG: phosphatase PAP2 family protein [Oscillospiraceae bacterium]|jgi:membrane-associated phospholipid phosphatase